MPAAEHTAFTDAIVLLHNGAGPGDIVVTARACF